MATMQNTMQNMMQNAMQSMMQNRLVRKKHYGLLCLMAVLLALVPLRLEAAQTSASDSASLKQVLAQMDAASVHFHEAYAHFNADLYTAIVEQHEAQIGQIAIRRHGKSVEMGTLITSQGGLKTDRQLLFKDGRFYYYEPNLKQETIYPASKSYEGFLSLGFGGSGEQLCEHWQVSLEGFEKIDGVEVARLNLVPKSAEVRNNFSHILLWIDPQRALAYKQKIFMPSGDTRTVVFTEMRYNQSAPSSMFTIHTAPGTKKIVK